MRGYAPPPPPPTHTHTIKTHTSLDYHHHQTPPPGHPLPFDRILKMRTGNTLTYNTHTRLTYKHVPVRGNYRKKRQQPHFKLDIKKYHFNLEFE